MGDSEFGHEVSEAMQKLASLIETKAEAQRILGLFGDEVSRGMWVSVWGIEGCRRCIALREREGPDVALPDEWGPLDWWGG